MTSPKMTTQKLIEQAAQADRSIANLRLILPKLDRLEADLRLVLVKHGLPLNDHLANRARISEAARMMIEADPGHTLADALKVAYADELKGA
jgi:hypothetical protein